MPNKVGEHKTTTNKVGHVVPENRRAFGTITARHHHGHKRDNCPADKCPPPRWRASFVGPDNAKYKYPGSFDTRDEAATWLDRQKQTIQDARMLGVQWESPTARAKRLAAEAAAEASRQSNTFGNYAARWLMMTEPRLRAKTVDGYRRALSGGLSHFNDIPLTDFDAAMIREWHNWRSEKRPTGAKSGRKTEGGPSVADAEARVLRIVLKLAVEENHIPSVPWPSKLIERRDRNHRNPTDGEMARLVEEVGQAAPRLRLAVMLAAYGGLRISEWRALTRDDLELRGKAYVVKVRRQAHRVDGRWNVGKPKTEAGLREVSLPPRLTADVSAHLKAFVGKGSNALLFTPTSRGALPGGRESGEYVDQAWRVAWDAAREAVGVNLDADGMRVREHDLRAYWATNLLARGASPHKVKEAGGWDNLRSMEPYIRRARTASPDLAELLDDLLPQEDSKG